VTAHRACKADDLVLGDAVVVELSRGASCRPREAVLVRDLSGAPRAYLNECKHLPVPLDAGSREFFDWGKTALLCGTHGALYDLSTGYCYDGPCIGTVLDALEVREEEGWLVVLDEPDP
jgi:nitrite reductase/ring-hydroxylating ferredoxin subunit